MNKFAFLKEHLDHLCRSNLLRRLTTVGSAQDTVVEIDGQERIVFCSNNYLNIANDPAVVTAVKNAVDEYGYGAAASRLISGTMTLHVEVETAFADFFRTEAALLFTSGWTANEAVIGSLPQKQDLVLLDKFDHASIIDAAKSCPAEFRTFRRNDFTKLKKLLADEDYERKYIITESVFSMDGDTADLKTLVELKSEYNAILIVDEAHALGCMGKTGAGLAEEFDLLDEMDIIIAPLGKAVAATGAVVAAKRVVIDYLINKARPFIYTTAPPVADCAAALAGLEIIKTEPQRRQKLKANADYLRSQLGELGIDTAGSTTHIIPIIIGTPEDALDISEKLYEKGFFIAAIRPPTVPKNTARLRVSLQANHTKEQINDFCHVLAETLKSNSPISRS
jgi:8-amino-7-oxononanoate synthase